MLSVGCGQTFTVDGRAGQQYYIVSIPLVSIQYNTAGSALIKSLTCEILDVIGFRVDIHFSTIIIVITFELRINVKCDK